MGRANIAYVLLRKGIASKRIMAWINNICRPGKYSEGSEQITLFSIFTMFATSGKISMEEVIKSTIDLGRPSRSWYKGLLLNARVDYIRSIIAQLHHGREVTVDNSERLQSI